MLMVRLLNWAFSNAPSVQNSPLTLAFLIHHTKRQQLCKEAEEDPGKCPALLGCAAFLGTQQTAKAWCTCLSQTTHGFSSKSLHSHHTEWGSPPESYMMLAIFVVDTLPIPWPHWYGQLTPHTLWSTQVVLQNNG